MLSVRMSILKTPELLRHIYDFLHANFYQSLPKGGLNDWYKTHIMLQNTLPLLRGIVECFNMPGSLKYSLEEYDAITKDFATCVCSDNSSLTQLCDSSDNNIPLFLLNFVVAFLSNDCLLAIFPDLPYLCTIIHFFFRDRYYQRKIKSRYPLIHSSLVSSIPTIISMIPRHNNASLQVLGYFLHWTETISNQQFLSLLAKFITPDPSYSEKTYYYFSALLKRVCVSTFFDVPTFKKYLKRFCRPHRTTEIRPYNMVDTLQCLRVFITHTYETPSRVCHAPDLFLTEAKSNIMFLISLFA
jgi:hypothetical protein